MLTRYRLLPALLAALVLTTSSACATGGYRQYPTAGARVGDDRAYRFGFESGLQEGRNDARRGRRLDYDRHDEFRSADHGYGGYGSRDEYRELFRRGFISGYDQGYQRNARVDRNQRSGPLDTDRERGAVSRSPAADIGFRDGVEAGRNDAKGGDRFDPVRAKRYREGDHDYNNRYGSRDEYKREYRNAFQQGYERGYREVRR